MENKHYKALEFDKVLEKLSKYAISKLAKEECLNLKVLKNKIQIEYELSLVDEAKKIIDDTQKYLPIGELIDVEEYFKNTHFLISEIVEMAKNLQYSRLTRNFLIKNEQAKNINQIISNLFFDKTIEDSVFDILDNEYNIIDSASDELKSLRNSYKDTKNNLKEAINSLLSNNSFVENLQDTVVSLRNDRTVFQVKASCKNKVSGIVHDVSSSNLTYFIEPSSIVPYSNKLKQIEIQIKAEIERIIEKLSLKFRDIKNELIENQKILTKLDVVFAKARYSIYTHSTRADLSNEKIIDIQKMYHPILFEVKDEIIKNDFIIGKDYNSLLITGANTGGKTVALKTVGLLVLMTKAGMHIPCLGAKIYPFNEIYCDISTEQNLEQGFSTYSAHIKNIAEILDRIDENSLVLFDELGSGTDPNEGSAIAKAILEYLKSKNTISIITTHLGELKTLKFEDKYFENATVLFDVNTLKPKYELVVGLSGSSSAIDISMQLGLKDEIIQNARKILNNFNSDNSNNILEYEKKSQELIEKQEKINIELENIEKLKEEYKLKVLELNKNKKKSLENFKKKFQDKLDNARDEIKKSVDEIRKEKSVKVAMRSYNRLNDVENSIRTDFSSSDDELAEKYKNLDINNLKIGQNVLVKKLNQVVILNSMPDKKGNVEVKIGNITSKINIKDLAYTDKKVEKALKKIKVSFENDYNLLSKLDLRGMRALEAIEYLDEKLDKASLKGLNQITVIHGYGTGALKKAVYDYLSDSPYVAKFHYAPQEQGSDGVVIVELV